MRGKLNLRFLLLVTVATLVFATGWFFLHRYQKNRRLSEYLTQATRAEEEKKPDRAARLLRAYVLAVPADIDAACATAGYWKSSARRRRPSPTRCPSTNRLSSKRRSGRTPGAGRGTGRRSRPARRMLPCAISHRYFKRTRTMVALFPTGVCQEAKKQYKEAAESYEKSAQVEPKPEAFVRWAGVLKVHLKQEDATADGTAAGGRAVLNKLVKVLPNSFESYLAHAAYRKTYDKKNGLTRCPSRSRKGPETRTGRTRGASGIRKRGRGTGREGRPAER